jgi:rhodanese-related sulfurtransferase
MTFKDARARALMLLASLVMVSVGTASPGAFGRESIPQNSSEIQFITADELKGKLAKNEPVVIIDVRATSGLLESDNKIKGAIHVKLRRLKSKLSFPPLKDVPRNREVVTYCACPNDESAVRAAQVLSETGFSRVRVLKGGWVTWKKVNGQMEPMARGI